MSEAVLKLGFWGVRGSTPTVERANWRYGGNTSCLELVAPDGHRFILDCGTGLRALGNRWAEDFDERPMQAHILLSHYHWDHIQGIPFFQPFYREPNCFHFYSFCSPALGERSLERVFEAQMAAPYFPVDLSVMAARREFTEIASGDHWQVGATRISALALHHPQGCLGFRFQTDAGTVVYATDHEPGDAAADRNLLELARNADILVTDAQYSPEQLAGPRRGWGHSSWQHAVNVAAEAGARELVLFHHDPDSHDLLMDETLSRARRQFAGAWAAAEGMVMRLAGGQVGISMRAPRTGQRREAYFRAVVTGQSDSGESFEEKTAVRDISFQGAFLYLSHVPRLRSELCVTMKAPVDEMHTDGLVRLRGYVVRREAGPDGRVTGVGVVFTEELPPERKAGQA
jgi:phosphoribosyl 1,2-cyclic phosphodiesterase